MKFITAEQVNQSLDFPELVNKLHNAFSADITVPMRNHFDIANPQTRRETTLLMMPAWQSGKDIGIKLVTVAPDNTELGLPSILGNYTLLDAATGQVKAIMDAPALTAKRTAAASALASRFLSDPQSHTLLMVGTGTLSTQLIQAHCQVRNISKVMVFGRKADKARQVIAALSEIAALQHVEFEVVAHLEQAVPQADIISVATLSAEPLIFGQWLRPGQHLDLVGAYRPDMREADDECVQRARLFVDNRESAIKETGDLAIPLAAGVIQAEAVEADLFALCRQEVSFTRSPSDITLFKSVGHALEDLAAAQLVWQHQE